MFRFVIQCCVLVCVLVSSATASAACNLQITGLSTNQTVILDADTIGTTDETTTVNFTVQNTGTSSCYYFLTMDEGISLVHEYNRHATITYAMPSLFRQANSEVILYQLYSQSVTANDIVKTLDHAQVAQNVLGPQEILAGQSLAESFIIHVPAQSLPDLVAESYADLVTLTLYQNPDAIIDFANDCPTCTEVSDQSIVFQFEITDFATLAIGDQYNTATSQAATLDFGVLYTNKADDFSVYVGGRTGSGSVCTVTMSSANGSKLIRQDITGTPQSGDMIDYTVSATGTIGSPNVAATIDLSTANTPVNLATSSVPFVCGDNDHGVMGVDVTVTIGNVDTTILFGGTFQDVITIEATIGL